MFEYGVGLFRKEGCSLNVVVEWGLVGCPMCLERRGAVGYICLMQSLINGAVLRVAGVFVVWRANVPPVESSLSIGWKANVPLWEKNRYTAGRRGSAFSCLCSIVGIRGEGSCLGKVRLTLDRVKGIWCLWQTPLDEYFADSRRMCIFAVHW